MSKTNISGIGSILSANIAVKQDSDGVKAQENSCFADLIHEAGKKSISTYGVQNQTGTTNSFQNEKLQSVRENASLDYDKYKYKNNSIQSQKNEIRDENVIAEKITEFTEEVKNVLKEEFGVTEEELEQAMETLGIQYLDLLDHGNLANLAATLTGSGNVNQLLCSETFTNVLQNIDMLGRNLLEFLQMNGTDLNQAFDLLVAEMNQSVPGDENLESVGEGIVNPEISTDETIVDQSAANSDAAESYTNLKNELLQSGEVKENQHSVGEAGQETEGNITALAEELSKEGEMSGDNQGKSGKSADSGEKTQMSGNHNNVDAAMTTTQNNFLEQLGEVETVQNISEYASVRDIVEQIVDSARVTLTNDMSKMEMQLNPENLGKIFLEITQKEGAVAAKIQTQNAIVKEALEAQITELKQNLNQAGVKVDSVEVVVASHEFERNLEQGARGEEQQAEEQEKARKQRKIQLDSLDELSGVMTEEETLVAKIMAEQGNSVDYTV